MAEQIHCPVILAARKHETVDICVKQFAKIIVYPQCTRDDNIYAASHMECSRKVWCKIQPLVICSTNSSHRSLFPTHRT